MQLELVTPEKKVFEGEALGVQLPGVDGSFEILNSHAPLISALEAGKLRIKTSKDQLHYQIDGGIVEVCQNKVIVLAESATTL